MPLGFKFYCVIMHWINKLFTLSLSQLFLGPVCCECDIRHLSKVWKPIWIYSQSNLIKHVDSECLLLPVIITPVFFENTYIILDDFTNYGMSLCFFRRKNHFKRTISKGLSMFDFFDYFCSAESVVKVGWVLKFWHVKPFNLEPIHEYLVFVPLD